MFQRLFLHASFHEVTFRQSLLNAIVFLFKNNFCSVAIHFGYHKTAVTLMVLEGLHVYYLSLL